MNPTEVEHGGHYAEALRALQQTLGKLRRCSPEEKTRLQQDVQQLHDMVAKLTQGSVEIVVFGEISTGKSALINALIEQNIAAVDVQGGWTKEVWQVPWSGCAYCVPGLADSQVVLVDTPGLNEVGGDARGKMAEEAARRADLILFVTDSDLNETEHDALVALASAHKPLLVVLNKIDLYTPEQRERLLHVLRQERLAELVPPDHVVATSADPREVEYVIESPDGSTRSQWRTPAADVEQLKAKILEVLEKDGLALLALNAAMYAADKTDRIATLRVTYREQRATQTIFSYAVLKAIAVSLNPVAVADVLGGSAVDVTMVATLAHIYGLEMSLKHARQLVVSIAKAAGWVVLGEALTNAASWAFKTLTVGYGVVLTAVPQGAAAGYGSFVVGQAAKYYFEHGSSWGAEGPKAVVKRILEQTDKASVLRHLKDEIRHTLQVNPHATKSSDGAR